MLAYILNYSHGKRKKLRINGSTQLKKIEFFETFKKYILLTIFAHFIRLFWRLVLRKEYRENESEILFGSYLNCVDNGLQELLLVTNCNMGIVRSLGEIYFFRRRLMDSFFRDRGWVASGAHESVFSMDTRGEYFRNLWVGKCR